jgi:hypothetical protein
MPVVWARRGPLYSCQLYTDMGIVCIVDIPSQCQRATISSTPLSDWIKTLARSAHQTFARASMHAHTRGVAVKWDRPLDDCRVQHAELSHTFYIFTACVSRAVFLAGFS